MSGSTPGEAPAHPSTSSLTYRVHGLLVVFAFACSLGGLLLLASSRMAMGLWLLGGSSIVAGLAALYSHRAFRLRSWDEPFSPLDGTRPRLDLEHFADLTPEVATFFTSMMLYPQSVTARISERIEPTTRAFVVQGEHAIRVPKPSQTGGSKVLYVPILTLRKGILLDSPQFTDASGSACHALTFDESVELVSCVLGTLVGKPKKYATKEHELVKSIRGPLPKTEAEGRRAGELLGELKAIVGDHRPGRLAVALAQRLIYHYVVILVITPPETGWLSIRSTERRLLPMVTPKFRAMWPVPFLLDRLRKVFGVRPNIFVVPLERGGYCNSYHLEFVGPPGTYLARQRIVNEDASLTSYRRMRLRFGQRYAHLYMRSTLGARKPQGWLQLSFFERPPGSLGAASIAAVASFVLILVASQLAAVDGVRGDVVAVLMAFPGVAAAWVGLDRPSGSFGGTLSARLSAFVTLSLSLASAALFLRAIHDIDLTRDLELWGAKGIWATVLIAALLNAVWINYSWLRKSVIHNAILARRDPNGAWQNGHRESEDEPTSQVATI